MKNSFKLNINNPCAEKFEDFRPTQTGGFCQSCQTEVIDFTNMSDQALIDYFQDPPTSACGRFHPTQLRHYSLPSKRKKHRLSWLGAGLLSLSIFAILPTGTLQAQKKHKPKKIERSTWEKEIIQDNQLIQVSGTVTDEYDGSPLPGVYVTIKGTTTGTVTGRYGKFYLKAHPQDILVFTYIGYEAQEIAVGVQSTIDVPLKESNVIGEIIYIAGAVEVEKPHQSKRTIWQRIQAIFRKKY